MLDGFGVDGGGAFGANLDPCLGGLLLLGNNGRGHLKFLGLGTFMTLMRCPPRTTYLQLSRYTENFLKTMGCPPLFAEMLPRIGNAHRFLAVRSSCPFSHFFLYSDKLYFNRLV
jgi:hypothetical protein